MVTARSFPVATAIEETTSFLDDSFADAPQADQEEMSYHSSRKGPGSGYTTHTLLHSHLPVTVKGPASEEHHASDAPAACPVPAATSSDMPSRE